MDLKESKPVFEKNHTYWIECPDFYVMGWYDLDRVVDGVSYHMFEQVMVIHKNGSGFSREMWIGLEDEEILSYRKESKTPHPDGHVYYKRYPPMIDSFIVGDEVVYQSDPKEIPARYYPE